MVIHHSLSFSAGRRLGKTIVIANKAINAHNDSDKDEVENDELDEELEQPAQKKFRQDCSQDCAVPHIDI
jgi:hypothetical protein